MKTTLTLLVRRGMEINRALTIATLGTAVMSALCVALLFLDPRIITGAPAWMKALKFFVSISLYNATWLWLSARLDYRSRRVRWSGNIIAFVGSFELLLIVVQTLRGIRSHFNVSTPLNTAIMTAMGVSIALLWLTNVVIAVTVMRRRFADPVLGWGIRLGLLASILGMASANIMFKPKPEQLAAMRAGHVSESGGHAVGAPDDGPGYPVVGWSKTGGDWRPVHFVGLHAMQVLPLLAWWLGRRRARGLATGHRVALVATGGFAYLGLMGVLFSQALRAQPVFRPDAVTLGALAALAAFTVAGIAATLAHARLNASQVLAETA